MQRTEKQSEIFKENQFEKSDRYLPYESPKLSKYGKVSSLTQSTIIVNDIDGFGFPFTDFS